MPEIPGPPPDSPADAVLIETGSFLIDRRRALDKLMRFQLPSPDMYVLSLIRCAVAGGASSVSVSSHHSGGLDVRFDGTPLSRAELEQPYAALFQEPGPENMRGRELAVGLLSLLRLKPRFITLRSGSGSDRFMVRIESLDNETLQPADDGLSLTLLRAVMPDSGDARLWNPRLAGTVRDNCRLCPIPVEIDGKVIEPADRRPPSPERIDFQEGAVRGWISVPYTPQARSDIAACRFGVLVQSLILPLPGVQITGAVNDDGFRLNASQTAILQDERLNAALAAAAARSPQLVAQTAAAQAERMAAIGPCLEAPEALERWKDLLEQSANVQAEGFLGSFKRLVSGAGAPDDSNPTVQGFPGDIRRTLWLRNAAASLLTNPAEDSADPVRKALWEVPLLFGTDLKPLSLAEFHSQFQRIGRAPYSYVRHPQASGSFRALWAYSPVELEFVRRWLPDRWSDIGPPPRGFRAGEPEPPEEGSPPRLESLGISDILVRMPFQQGRVAGEAALTSHRPENGALIQLFLDGKPANSFEMRGPLHYAIAATGAADPAAVERAASEVLPKLYEKASREFSPDSPTERDHALRLHLTDFLAWACEDPARLERHRWISTASLFGASWSLRSRFQILEMLGVGATMIFSRKAAPEFQIVPVLSDAGRSRETLSKLFPECSLVPVPGPRKDLLFVFQRPRCPDGHPDDCLVEWTLDEGVFHLAPGSGRPDTRIETPWGSVRARACKDPGAMPASLPEEAGAALLLAVLRERGTLFDEPSHPWRSFVLAGARHFAAPWHGPAGAPKRIRFPRWRRRLLEVLGQLPFFATPDGEGMSLETAAVRLESGRTLVPRFEGRDAPAQPADIVIGREEFALLQALWPAFGVQRPSPRGSAAPPPPAKDSPAEPLSFDEPMLFQARFTGSALRCLAGLPREPVPGVSATVLQLGRVVRGVVLRLPRPLSGSIIVDASSYPAPIDSPEGLHPDLERILEKVYLRLLSSLLDQWSAQTPAASGLDELSVYPLLLLQPPGEPSGKDWDEARSRARRLAMFDTLAGGRVSLEELAAQARQAGFLRYVPSKPAVTTQTPSLVAVLPYPQLTLNALGGVPLKKYTGAPTRRTAPPPPRAGPPLESRLSALLSDLRGCRGIDMSDCPSPDTVRLVQGSGEDMLPVFREGRWDIDEASPLVKAVLASGLPPEDQADYLASLVYTQANRRLPGVTDAEDSAFQEALANRLSQDL